MRIILSDVCERDAPVAVSAAIWLLAQPPEQKDAILVYGEHPNELVFYVKRNKESITARRISQDHKK